MPKAIRQIRVEGNIAYVPLTLGHEAIIDASDVFLVSQWNWHAMPRANTVYAKRTDNTQTPKQTVLLHRAILSDRQSMIIDHRNGNGLDNRRCNLRFATNAQNQHNRRIGADNTSGFKGVYWHQAGQGWAAQISLNGKIQYLGIYETAQCAHAAYCEASAKLHGPFGRTE